MDNSFNSIAKIPTPTVGGILESESIFTQIVFLIFVVVVWVFLFRLVSSFISYYITDSSNTHLLDGVVIASQQKIITQNPNTTGSKTVYRSVNQGKGIEFTWSVWINISQINYDKDEHSTIFYKGNNNTNDEGLNYPNNSPGLYLKPLSNDLLLVMNTFSKINEEIEISDIPLNKWVNIIIRCQNRTIDVYVNGTITRSLELGDVPKQNYGDVYVGTNGGFYGYISDLWYFDHALGPGQIMDIVKNGPNLTASDKFDVFTSKISDFFSLRWYFNQYQTQS
jgi:hypothetical protein